MVALDRVSHKSARRGAAKAERDVILEVMNDGLPTTLFASILTTLMTGSG